MLILPEMCWTAAGFFFSQSPLPRRKHEPIVWQPWLYSLKPNPRYGHGLRCQGIRGFGSCDSGPSVLRLGWPLEHVEDGRTEAVAMVIMKRGGRFLPALRSDILLPEVVLEGNSGGTNAGAFSRNSHGWCSVGWRSGVLRGREAFPIVTVVAFFRFCLDTYGENCLVNRCMCSVVAEL